MFLGLRRNLLDMGLATSGDPRAEAASAMRRLRLSLGLTQADLARRAACSRASVNRAENNHAVSGLLRRAISRALDAVAREIAATRGSS